MSYLLGYQKWKKLHESATYGKIYEQAFNSATPVDFAVLGGTSPTAIYDAGLAKLGMKATGTGNEVKLYEISVLDALQGNFQNVVEVKALNATDIKDRDRVQVLSGENVIAEVSGPGVVTFTYSPKLKDTKLRVSGNGALSLLRASNELKENDSIDLTKHSGNIRLYVSQEKSPIADSPRFSKIATVAGTGVDALKAKVNSFCIQPALHYMVEGEDNKKYIETVSSPQSFKNKMMYDPSVGPNDNPILLSTPTGPFVGTQNKYSGLDSFKNTKPEGFWTNPNAPVNSRILKPEIDSAIQEYVKVCLDNFTKDGGTIDQYFTKSFGQIGEDLLTPILAQAKTQANAAKEKALADTQRYTLAKQSIGRMPLTKVSTTPTAGVKSSTSGQTYGEGER